MQDGAAVPGNAATAMVEGRRVAAGSPGYARGQGVDLGALGSTITSFEEAGKTAVVVLEDGRVLGVLAMRDELREDAAEAIATLKRMGVTSVMLTGDNERTGRAIASASAWTCGQACCQSRSCGRSKH